MRRGLLVGVGAVLLAVLTSGCTASEAPGNASAGASSERSKHEFAVLNVESADGAPSTATLYAPLDGWNGGVALVSQVSADALPTEVCRVTVLEEVTVSGADCDATVARDADGYITRGVSVHLTNLEPGNFVFDVQVFPVPTNLNTGQYRFDYIAPAAARLWGHVPPTD